MKILAFAASSSSKSINRQLIGYAARILEHDLVPGCSVEVLDLNDYEMPIYSIDREERDGVPSLAVDLFAKIGEADALAVSYAEHNGTYTAAFKNVLDWISRIDKRMFQEKPMVLFATSTGAGGAARVLSVAVADSQPFGADLRGSLSIPSFAENFDTGSGSLTDAELDTKFREVLDALRPVEAARHPGP